MAMVHELTFATRRECLEKFAGSLGEYQPRDPVPDWFTAFDRWYRKVGGRALVRTEAFGYDLEDDGNENDEA